MTFNTLIYEKDGAIGIVTLNWPKSLNASSDELLVELGRALDEIEADQGVGAVIVTGQEKAFGAGADITEIANLRSPADANRFTNKVRKVFGKLAELRQPTIAAVSGLALGGGRGMDLDTALAHEARNFEILFSTEDQKGGMKAFLEKRKPSFKGR
jgi:enoyl-CoA hydratase/carnithine racemase